MNMRRIKRCVHGGIPMLIQRSRDRKYPSLASTGFGGSPGRYFACPPMDYLNPFAEEILCASNQYLKHSFDLLGSGCVNVRYGMPCQGMGMYRYANTVEGADNKNLELLINVSNQEKAKEIRGLLTGPYVPIDWQVDFKSGYRWGEGVWFKDIFYGELPGADIKVPWELARMQHLACLVWAYVFSKNRHSGFQPPQVYLAEFQNQILDFISSNPPRWGVNWSSPMEAVIRAANWLVAYDLFKSAGAQFESGFEKHFWESIYFHGKHVIQNLEWGQSLRSNHYLSNIVGLLFIGAYLPESPETDGWLALAVRELIHEVKLQFYDDGGNIEGASCYHRFSSEMAAYGTAIILALPPQRMKSVARFKGSVDNKHFRYIAEPLMLFPQEEPGNKSPFSEEYWERLERMAEFAACLIKPEGTSLQTGDNDNGRFIKLFPSLKRAKDSDSRPAECFEDSLDFRHLIGCLNGFFNRDDFRDIAGPYQAEENLIKNLIKRSACLSPKRGMKSCHLTLGESTELREFPGFGMFIYRNNDCYCAVRCGSSGQMGCGAHAHNDQLSFELSLGGQSVIVDPGTFTYSALPEERNLFRSTAMHNTLVNTGVEQNDWKAGVSGLFRLNVRSQFKVLETSNGTFRGVFENKMYRHERRIEFLNREIRFRDVWAGDGSFEIVLNCHPDIQVILSTDGDIIDFKGCDREVSLTFSSGEASVIPGVYSRGYGHRVPSQKIRIRQIKSPMEWSIQWK